jgi:hypothetical protein
VPLVIATGASKLAFRNVSTPVFGGMLAASILGIFVIPPLYVMFQSLREWLKGEKPMHHAAAAAEPARPQDASQG